MAIRLINRPSVTLQEPESGLDVFLKEVAKYSSPEYQLRRKESERADARLELSKRQQEQTEERYADLLNQQDIENRLASNREERLQSDFEMKQKQSYRNMAQESIRNQTAGMNAEQIANYPIEAYSSDVDDPKLKMSIARQAKNVQKNAKLRVETIQQRISNHNSKYPDNQISDNEGMLLFSDDTSYREHLSNLYLDVSKKGDLTPQQLGQIRYLTGKISDADEQVANIRSQLASGIAIQNAEDKITDFELMANNARNKVEGILGITAQEEQTGGDPYGDAYEDDAYKQVDTKIASLYGEDALDPSSDTYKILFADDLEIPEPPMDIATENAKDESEIISGIPTVDIQPEEEESEEKTSVADRLLSGLSGVQAQPTEKTEPSEAPELFPEQEEKGVFGKEIPGKDKSIFNQERRLRNPSVGSKILKKKIKNLKKDIRISETAPNLKTRENFKKGLPKQIQELKDLFSVIYDESTNAFYNPNNPKAGTYEDRLGQEDIEFLKGL